MFLQSENCIYTPPPDLRPPCSLSVGPSVTLRTLSTSIPKYIFPTNYTYIVLAVIPLHFNLAQWNNHNRSLVLRHYTTFKSHIIHYQSFILLQYSFFNHPPYSFPSKKKLSVYTHILIHLPNCSFASFFSDITHFNHCLSLSVSSHTSFFHILIPRPQHLLPCRFFSLNFSFKYIIPPQTLLVLLPLSLSNTLLLQLPTIAHYTFSTFIDFILLYSFTVKTPSISFFLMFTQFLTSNPPSLIHFFSSFYPCNPPT